MKQAERLSTLTPVMASAPSQRLFEMARRVAATDCTVLITGESGTGKEIVARYIHENSSRRTGPFVAINCAAIPENMLEALLFGYEKGAFTGASASHQGKFEQAQSGTLLLDEVSEMPLGLQAKLLRVLQEREVERLGAATSFCLDVRVLATSNRNLQEEVRAGHFREDLFYRLNVFPLKVVPLRERREDILPLAMRLLHRSCADIGRVPAIEPDAALELLRAQWRGNVRELDNVLQRAAILADGANIQQHHIRLDANEPAGSASFSGAASLNTSLRETENNLILATLRSANGDRRRVAEQLGISPRTLRYKIARLRTEGLEVPLA
ncbi:MAG: sigma-54 dependent transcriptional regulator [Steroidobacteraceae bacterium]